VGAIAQGEWSCYWFWECDNEGPGHLNLVSLLIQRHSAGYAMAVEIGGNGSSGIV